MKTKKTKKIVAKKVKFPAIVPRYTTPYDILTTIQALAKEEPRRIYMNLWISKSVKYINGVLQRSQEERGERRTKYIMPACGTVGCIAGWAKALLNPTGITDGDNVDAHGYARDVLGLTNEQAYSLFAPGGLETWPKGGTRAHALQFIAHIEAFKVANEAQLKSKFVEIK